MATKLTENEKEACRKVRAKLSHPTQDFTVDEMFPTVKRGRFVFDSLERKGFLESEWKQGEKSYHFTNKAQYLLGEKW